MILTSILPGASIRDSVEKKPKSLRVVFLNKTVYWSFCLYAEE